VASIQEELEGSFLRFDEQFTAVALAIIAIVGVFAVSQSVLARRVVEPFSELGVLGPSLKLGDYPKQLVVGRPYDLYLYLGNHEGRVMYYRVLIKIGDQTQNVSDTEPLEAPVMDYYEAIIPHECNQTLPMVVSVSEPGVNRRMVFELHAYDGDVGGFIYLGQWCQLWFNATSPTG
jgi:uncharacterized membrane protein